MVMKSWKGYETLYTTDRSLNIRVEKEFQEESQTIPNCPLFNMGTSMYDLQVAYSLIGQLIHLETIPRALVAKRTTKLEVKIPFPFFCFLLSVTVTERIMRAPDFTFLEPLDINHRLYSLNETKFQYIKITTVSTVK